MPRLPGRMQIVELTDQKLEELVTELLGTNKPLHSVVQTQWSGTKNPKLSERSRFLLHSQVRQCTRCGYWKHADAVNQIMVCDTCFTAEKDAQFRRLRGEE